MAAALYSLDEARPLSRAGRLAAWVGAVVYLGASLGVLSRGSDPWPALVWVPIAHALVLVVVCGLTSLLLYGQASATGRRGYLWLGGTYLYVAVLLLSFPLFFPGGFGGEEPLLGGQQSAPWMFYIWHFAFAGGLMVAVCVFHIDRVRHRRPGLVVDMWPSVVGVVIAALLTVGFVAVEDTAFRPTLLAQEVGLTSLAAALDWLLLGFSLAATALSLWCQRGGALIQRWLSAVLVLQLGAAIVNMNANRWSFGWYFDRLFGMVALTSLLIFLVFSLARAGQATNIVASSDTLTRSESRASFTQSMEQEIAAARLQGQSVALLWVDLDGFKGVNDQFGHQVGDDVLRVTVNRILGQVRDADHVGRLGGDEIGVLLCEGVADDARDPRGRADPGRAARAHAHRRAPDPHHGIHRDRHVPDRRRSPRRADHPGGPGDVRGQERRRGPVPAVQREARLGGDGHRAAAPRPGTCGAQRRLRAGLPADRGPGVRCRGGGGGTGQMAAPRAAGPGRPVHGVRGEDGPDRRDRTADPRSGGA